MDAKKCQAREHEEKGDCIFCKLANKELDTALVYEDKLVFAFLDTSPAGVLAGHTQVITKKHYSDITNCPEKDLKALIVAVKKIAIAVKKVSCAQGINVLQNNGRVAGQFVSHIHFHIIPRKQDDGIWFDTKRRNPAPMELVETAKAIKEELKKES